MIEVIIISIILFIVISASLLLIRYILTHKRTPLSYAGITTGIIISDIFLLIIGLVTIFRYLQM